MKQIIKKWIQHSSFLDLDSINSIWHKLLITPQYSAREIYIPKSYYQKHQLETANLPKISLVTPSYNHAYFIETTVTSILDQKYPNLEYIIQDGKSKDNTDEVLK